MFDNDLILNINETISPGSTPGKINAEKTPEWVVAFMNQIY